MVCIECGRYALYKDIDSTPLFEDSIASDELSIQNIICTYAQGNEWFPTCKKKCVVVQASIDNPGSMV